jgi:glycosyltransferase involved in cell wall biosynthesis
LWQPNAGEAKARHSGLSAARGEFIAFLDADDLWHPEKLTRQIDRFRERAEIDLCFTCFQNFWVPELVEEERRYQGSPLSRPQSAWSTSTLLARRTVFATFGNFTDDGTQTPGSESMIWFLHAVEAGAVVEVLPHILMYRRMHSANASRKNPVETFFPILKEWRDYQRRRRGGSDDTSR